MLCAMRPVQTGGTFIWLRCWTSTSSITARKTCEHSHTPVTMRYVRVSTLITRSHTSRRSQCKTKCSGQKNNTTYGRRLSSSESHRHTRTRQFTARRPAPFLGSRSALPRQNTKKIIIWQRNLPPFYRAQNRVRLADVDIPVRSRAISPNWALASTRSSRTTKTRPAASPARQAVSRNSPRQQRSLSATLRSPKRVAKKRNNHSPKRAARR